jgi:hypothetical protein
MTRREARGVRLRCPTLAEDVCQLRANLDALCARVSAMECALDDVREKVDGLNTSDLEARLDEIETAAAVRAAEW